MPDDLSSLAFRQAICLMNFDAMSGPERLPLGAGAQRRGAVPLPMVGDIVVPLTRLANRFARQNQMCDLEISLA